MRKTLTNLAIVAFLVLVALQAVSVFGQVVGLQPTPMAGYTWDTTTNQWDKVSTTETANPYPTTPQAFAWYRWNASLEQWVPCETGDACNGGIGAIVPGANITCSPEVNGQCTGIVTLNASSGLTLQHDAVNLTDQDLLNFVDDSTITPDSGYTLAKFLNNSTGALAAEYISNNLQMQVPDPLGTQSVVIYPTTSVAANNQPTTCVATVDPTNPATGTVNVYGPKFPLYCNAPFPTITFSGFALPSYVNPSNVTAIYAFSTNSSYGSDGTGAVLACTNGGSGSVNLAAQTNYSMQSFDEQLTGVTGSTLSAVTCTASNGDSDTRPAGWFSLFSIASVGVRVYYTGTAPPVSNAITVEPPLNLTLGNLSIDPSAAFPGLYAVSYTIGSTLPAAGAAVVNQGYLVEDSTDCATVTAGPPVWCYSDGSAWHAFGGGGGGVTTFAAPSGSWPSWLVPTVTDSTTTPSLAVAASAIPNSALANDSITLGSTSIVLGATETAVTGLEVNGVTLTTSDASTTYLNGAGSYTTPSGSGSGTVSGQASGVIPLGTSATVIGNQSHLDDGNTTAGTITSTEPIDVNDLSAAPQIGMTYNSHALVPGSSTTAIYGVGSAGQAEVSEAGGAAAEVCTATNGACGGGGISYPSGTGVPQVVSGASWATTLGVQGSGDSNVLLAGTVSGTAASLCTDSNGGATTSGCSSGGVQYNPSTTAYVWVGASENIAATGNVNTTTSAGSCDGTTCTATGTYTYTSGQMIDIYNTSASCLNGQIAPLQSASGTTITWLEASYQGVAGCTGTQTFTTASIQDATYFPPILTGTMPFFKGHGQVYDWGVSGEVMAGMISQYSGTIHPLSPSVTGHSGYLFISSGAVNDLTSSSANLATLEGQYCSYWALAHADNWTIVEEPNLDFPFDNVSNESGESHLIWASLNQWLSAQGKGSANSDKCSNGQYWDLYVDTNKPLGRYTNTQYFNSSSDAFAPYHNGNSAAWIEAFLRNRALSSQAGDELNAAQDVWRALHIYGDGLYIANSTYADPPYGYSLNFENDDSSNGFLQLSSGLPQSYSGGLQAYAWFNYGRLTLNQSNSGSGGLAGGQLCIGTGEHIFGSFFQDTKCISADSDDQSFDVGSGTPGATASGYYLKAQGLGASTATDPTHSLFDGLFWYNTTSHQFKFDWNGTTATFGANKLQLTTAYTNATATPSTIWSFAVGASANYHIHCGGLYKAASGGAFELTVTGPASPTNVSYNFAPTVGLISGAPTVLIYPATGTSYPSGLNAVAVTTAATDMPFSLDFDLINGTTSGTLAIQGNTISTNTLTIEIGATCTIQ